MACRRSTAGQLTIMEGLETRAVRIRPEVVLACEASDLNIVLERLSFPAAERLDPLIATNIFVYYQPFEQTLALENAGAMLRPGGLLTNDRLREVPGGSMHLAGTTQVQFNEKDRSAAETIGYYQKR
jgi:hypothetical protein